MTRRIQFVFFIFYLCICSLNAEIQMLQNEEKNYNVSIEIESIGVDLNPESLKDYANELLSWSNEIGKNTRILTTLPDEVDWAIKQQLFEYDKQNNETFIARITYDFIFKLNRLNSFKHNVVVFTFSSDDLDKIKIETSIEVDVLLDNPEENTIETSEGEYENKTLGYKGSSIAYYVGIDLNDNQLENLNTKIYEMASDNGIVRKITKFTKEQEWLVSQSLKKYQLKKGETYIVSVVVYPKSSPTTFTAVICFVIITDIDNYQNYTYNFLAYESTEELSKASSENDSVIESRIDGEFSGWSGDTIFKLQNGQIWQQIEYSYKYSYKYCPKVTIVKTSTGWKMQVEGIDKTIRVKRLK